MRHNYAVRVLRLHAVQRYLELRFGRFVDQNEPMVRLGSELCGWWVPVSATQRGTVCYCAGAGEDITFDLEMLARGCRVTTFDPTPRAVEYVESLDIEDDHFRFVPVGWWDSATTLKFYIPRQADNYNLSAVNLQQTSTYLTAEVKPVNELMQELGDTSVDLIKLDVEGAEYRVLESLLAHGPLPRFFCIEFDQPQPPARTVAMVEKLLRLGYRLTRIDFFNYTFIRATAPGANLPR